MSIIVFGSVNMDLVVRTPHLPTPGQTLIGHQFETVPGGKGANQAVACARLGANTHMVGRVGGDAFGEALRHGLKSARVNVSALFTDTETASGVAMITVDDTGENTIIVIPGANGRVNADDLTRLEKALDPAKILLLQLEIPLEMTLAAAKLAHSRGVTVILDPAPAQALPDALYRHIDILTPNENEAAALVGFALNSDDAIQRAAQQLRQRGTRQIIIKLGSRGAYWQDEHDGGFLPAYPVNAVDTVAAGDAFNGGLAAALSLGHDLKTALQWAMAAGALATTQPGAQSAMPDLDSVITLTKSQLH